jgi:hypothetical protein
MTTTVPHTYNPIYFNTASNSRRTFLSWLHFAVVLGGLAVGLLNFGDKVGKISAAMYTIIGQFPAPSP